MDEVVTLQNLGGGAASELFNKALEEVLANIHDPNVIADEKREITLKLVVQPQEDRGYGAFDVTVKTKLAGPKPAGGTMYFGTVRGAYVAVESNPKQKGLFDEQPSPVEPVNATAERRTS